MAIILTILFIGLVDAAIVSLICIVGSFPGERLIPTICFFASVICFYFLVTNSYFQKIMEESAAKMQAEEYERSRPHLLYRENDCEVYEFWANGTQHYFTKCSNSKTTTETPAQRVGKITQPEEIIVTH